MADGKEITKTNTETRTPAFYDYLRSTGITEKEIDQTRSRLANSLFPDTLTDYFIHEANNALGFVHDSTEENGKTIVNWTPGDFTRHRERLLHIRNGLGWFTQTGVIPIQVIVNFIDTAETQGEWNQQVVEQLNEELIKIKTAFDLG